MTESTKADKRYGFEGRTALVTGASRGIGRAIALELASRGTRVAAVARDRRVLEAIAKESDLFVAAPTDLADDASVDALLAEMDRSDTKVDLLIHCAGAITHSPTLSADIEDFDRMIGVNLRGAYRLTQGLLSQLIEREGDVVFVNSSVTRYPRAQSGQYAATQHALKGFADSLREELNPLGVRVLSVFPGKTATPLQESLHRDRGDPYRPERLLQPEDIAEVVCGAVVLPRRAEVTDIRIRPAIKG